MEMPFGLYPRFYVRRKELLFPIIEKYTGEKITAGTPHGKIIPVYYRLLKTDEAFRAEIDSLIAGQESKLMTAKQKVALKKENKNIKLAENLHNPGYLNAADPVTAIASAIGNIFGTIKTNKEADLQSDQFFYETVLNEQKNNDTGKLLIVTGVTLAFVGLGVFLVLKLRK